MRARTAALVAAAALLVPAALAGAQAGGSSAATAAATAATVTAPATAPVTGNHLVTNLHGATTGPRRLGFTVFDTGASLSQVNALPAGVRALVWLGQKCPTAADDAFRAKVRALAGTAKVLGYYLSDEPHIADCPGGPAGLASRAAFVRSATSGRQKSFVMLSKVTDFGPFRPAVSKVDMVGLDPYPCSVPNPTCDLTKIDQRVSAATAAGIPLARIVPTYQVFGQSATPTGTDHYYLQPTAAQLRAMVLRWGKVVPAPPMDYTYGWGHQDSANPTLVDSLALQRVLAGYFGGTAPASSR